MIKYRSNGVRAAMVAEVDEMSQTSEDAWDIWKERAFIEPLANQRLNFLLVFTPVVIVASEQVKSHAYKMHVKYFCICRCMVDGERNQKDFFAIA